MKLILASASQRRKELLSRITEDFEVIVSNFDESTVPFEGECFNYVMNLSKGKALDVANKANKDSIIVGCDTIVSIDNKILEKPKDREDAINMLKSLSGKIHEVYSGITVINTKTKEIKNDYVCTYVKFSHLTVKEVVDYVDTGDPYDKAGAYGIQGKAGVFVEEIKGCYYSVVGLPLNKLNKMFREMGVKF